MARKPSMSPSLQDFPRCAAAVNQRESSLLPSGLLGPVTVRTGRWLDVKSGNPGRAG